MAMDQFLAEFYGTKTAAAPQEDLEKQASVELFLKLAGEQGIDIKSMPDEQVQELYTRFEKVAAEQAAATPGEKTAAEKEHEAAESKKQEKLEEAKKEHEEKKAYAEKVAEADFLGRVMAHAYVQEMKKIASAQEPEAAKTAAMPPALAAALGKKDGDEKGEKKEEKPEEKKEEKDEKKASAIDELAAERAVLFAKQANFDPAQAGRRVAAVLELGLIGQSAKVAAAVDADAAVSIRALELLEKAGYEVNWK